MAVQRKRDRAQRVPAPALGARADPEILCIVDVLPDAHLDEDGVGGGGGSILREGRVGGAAEGSERQHDGSNGRQRQQRSDTHDYPAYRVVRDRGVYRSTHLWFGMLSRSRGSGLATLLRFLAE